MRIGFEQTLDCWSAPWSGWPGGNSLSLEGLTPRQAFDRLLSHRPDYRWAEIDGVVVIRPVPAWAPEGSVLNGPVAAFAVVDDHSHYTLHAIFLSARPSLFHEHTDLQLSSSFQRLDDPRATAPIDAPISLRFAGGTLLQALNAVTQQFGGIWEVCYSAHGDRLRSIHVELRTLDAYGGATHLSSTPFSIATGSRPTARGARSGSR